MEHLYRIQFITINYIYKKFFTVYCRFKLKMAGAKCGKKVIFKGNVILYKSSNSTISIGNNCRFNSMSRFNYRGINHPCILQTSKGGSITIGDNCGFSGVSIVSSISVVLGNNVLCGTNVTIGDRNDHEDLYPQFIPYPIQIGNNVWIGMNTVIMKGVDIGDNVIIGANSIVTKSIPSNVIATGNPCKIIKNV